MVIVVRGQDALQVRLLRSPVPANRLVVQATHLETLSALAVWRQWIDDAGGDPREELAFHVQLANYGHTYDNQAAASRGPGNQAHLQSSGR
jgi:hypothetical protein